MKRDLFALVIVLMFAFTAFGQKAAAAKADPAKGVREAFERLIDGIKQVDVDKVMDSYEKTERLMIFNNNGTATNGWENVKTNITASYAKISNVTLDVTGLRVEMLGAKAAYISCKWKQTQENDAKPETASGRMTLVFKLIGKDWKITHRHTSPDKPDATRPVFSSERVN